MSTAAPPALASDPILQALCPLAFNMRRGGAPVVGRASELDAIEAELESARTGLCGVTLEGEPGIGKTRLLLAATQLAGERGFTAVAVAADEELRGPFLLMRSILSSALGGEHGAPAATGPAGEAVQRALRAMSGHDDPTLEGMPADQRLLRQFDLATLAMRALAAERPLAVLADNIQWADADSLRALRYVIRSDPGSPILLLLTMRPEETAQVTEAVTLIVDMERMGLIRRLRLSRFTQAETATFLRQTLGGPVAAATAATIHAQAEGVPFIIEELAHAYRDAAMIQSIDGAWTLAKNADRLAPSAVQTLIQRRSGRLPEETKTSLSEAAVLGRSFSLRDLQAVKARLGDADAEADLERLAESMSPAAAAGLLQQHQPGSPADYNFTHEQVRQFSLASLSPTRRRAIHAAIVQMLCEGGDPSPESMPLLAHHAAEAGDAERCARFSIAAARAALASHAPDEVLRAVEVALPLATDPADRVTLLTLRDDAMDIIRRPLDRLEALSELAALADALGDAHLELDVMLRRASALRIAGEEDRAASLARRVAELAEERADAPAGLAAWLELGQAIMHSELGEGYVPSAAEVDLDAGAAAFSKASALAEELGDEGAVAAAERELGAIEIGRVRAWFVERLHAGEHMPILARSAAGESLDEIMLSLPIGPNIGAAGAHLARALELFEKTGDRRGVMSTVIAMAYQRFGGEIHLGANPAQRIEEIRRLATRLHSLSRESERAAVDAQMAYGVHVFARAKVIPDLAVSRGEEAYWAAKTIGDRSLEFLAAGGTAMAHLDLDDVGSAERWLDLAAQVAAAAPTALRARRLELWRALARARAGDAAAMVAHFDRALQAASSQGRPAGRCEVLARMALEAARLGAQRGDEELLGLAERSAEQAKEIVGLFVTHQPWGAQADAALAEIALARGDTPAAAEAARRVAHNFEESMREDVYPEMLLPAARALLAAGTDGEREWIRGFLQILLALTAQRTVDESVRVRWFRGPIGGEWARLAGPAAEGSFGGAAGNGALSGLDEDERRLLGRLTEGLTTREIADREGISAETAATRLQHMFAKVGASSRGEATAFALREGVV
jgi:DNA-binding CsgD family transcriptional regulator